MGSRLAARVCLLATMLLAHGLQAAAQEPTRGWLDVNIGMAESNQKDWTSTRITTISQEFAGGSAAYSLPRGASFDFGGGYMFTPRVGLGVTFGGTAHEDIAGLAVSVPHPLYFDRSDIDATVTNGKLQRIEGAVHITGMVVLASGRHFSVRVFGGPTFFRVQQDVIGVINYSQVYNLAGANNVTITTYDTDKTEGTGWGAHVGADAGFFFNHVVGIGGLVRYSRGKVEIVDYGGPEDTKVGGVQVSGGLRLRF